MATTMKSNFRDTRGFVDGKDLKVASQTKDDLRKHHFDFGKSNTFMTTTSHMDYGKKSTQSPDMNKIKTSNQRSNVVFGTTDIPKTSVTSQEFN